MDKMYAVITTHPVDAHPAWYLCAFRVLRVFETDDEMLRKAGRAYTEIEFAPYRLLPEIGLRPDRLYEIGVGAPISELERFFPLRTHELTGFVDVVRPTDGPISVKIAGHGAFYLSQVAATADLEHRDGRKVNLLD